MPAAAALTAQVALNRDLYGLLIRRTGLQGAAAGVGLHVIHQLTAAAALPAGLLASVLKPRDG